MKFHGQQQRSFERQQESCDSAEWVAWQSGSEGVVHGGPEVLPGCAVPLEIDPEDVAIVAVAPQHGGEDVAHRNQRDAVQDRHPRRLGGCAELCRGDGCDPGDAVTERL